MLIFELLFCIVKMIDENVRYKVDADTAKHCRQKIKGNRHLRNKYRIVYGSWAQLGQ